MSAACAWCGAPVGLRARWCSDRCRKAAARGRPALVLLRDTQHGPVFVERTAWPVCEACGCYMPGRRAGARTCSDRCRVALHRGTPQLGLAEVHGRHVGCGGVTVWRWKPPPDGSPGVVACTKCGAESWAGRGARAWEEAVLELDDTTRAAWAGELPPDEEEDVYPDSDICNGCPGSAPPAHPAALYVDVDRGPYPAMGLDCWGEDRRAETYPGPGPVIAHVPCGPWGRLAHLCGPELLAQKHLGPVAVDQVRRFRGVLEHPADSRLWAACGMPRPGELPDAWGGWTLAVEQWWWGHRAVKPTWLYIVGTFDVPPVPVPVGQRPASGGREARRRDPRLRSMLERLPSSQRHVTPPAFAAWLVELVRSLDTEEAILSSGRHP